MRAHPAAGQQKWIALADRVDRTLVVAFTDLSDIARDIDFRRAGLATGSQAVPMGIEMHQPLGHGPDLHHIFWAYRFTDTAANTFFGHDNRVTFRSHF